MLENGLERNTKNKNRINSCLSVLELLRQPKFFRAGILLFLRVSKLFDYHFFVASVQCVFMYELNFFESIKIV